MSTATSSRLTRLTAFLGSSYAVLVAVAAQAQGTPTNSPTPAKTPSAGAVGLPRPLGLLSIQDTIGKIIQALMGLIGTAALLMFIYGGFVWLTSQGDPGKVKQAKETIIWAVIGIVAVLGAYSILRFVTGALTVSGL